MQTLEALLRQARQLLGQVETPSLDARLLLMQATGLSATELIAGPSQPVSVEVESLFLAMVQRRVQGEPISRILGKRDFYGRSFSVSPAVLDPRADTEVLIDASLSALRDKTSPRLVDLGTGSGIIAITLLLECERASGVAVDISAQALRTAIQNAEALGVGARLAFAQGRWFDGVEGVFDLIVSNPPYIVAADIADLDIEVRGYDPHLALDGGEDGLSCYRDIAASAGRHLAQGGHVVVEVGAGQANQVAGIFRASGFDETARHQDLGGHERVLTFMASRILR